MSQASLGWHKKKTYIHLHNFNLSLWEEMCTDLDETCPALIMLSVCTHKYCVSVCGFAPVKLFYV